MPRDSQQQGGTDAQAGVGERKMKALPFGSADCSLKVPSSKIANRRNCMIPLVAGGGFEPPTFGL